jgi:hypothetical protein
MVVEVRMQESNRVPRLLLTLASMCWKTLFSPTDIAKESQYCDATMESSRPNVDAIVQWRRAVMRITLPIE